VNEWTNKNKCCAYVMFVLLLWYTLLVKLCPLCVFAQFVVHPKWWPSHQCSFYAPKTRNSPPHENKYIYSNMWVHTFINWFPGKVHILLITNIKLFITKRQSLLCKKISKNHNLTLDQYPSGLNLGLGQTEVGSHGALYHRKYRTCLQVSYKS